MGFLLWIPLILFGWHLFFSSHPFAFSHIPAIPPSYVLDNTYGSSTTNIQGHLPCVVRAFRRYSLTACSRFTTAPTGPCLLKKVGTVFTKKQKRCLPFWSILSTVASRYPQDAKFFHHEAHAQQTYRIGDTKISSLTPKPLILQSCYSSHITKKRNARISQPCLPKKSLSLQSCYTFCNSTIKFWFLPTFCSKSPRKSVSCCTLFVKLCFWLGFCDVLVGIS